MEKRIFDKKDYFTQEVRPLLRTLIQKFCDAQLPFFISVGVADDGEKTTFEETVRSPGGYGYSISDDRIVKYVKIASGFDVIPTADNDDIITL